MCIIFGLACCVCLYFGARWLRRHHYEPKYIPGQFFKRKWKQWSPGSAAYGQVPTPRSNNDSDTAYHGGGNPEMATVNPATGNGVQRETSIRSIMTLPPYSASPKPTERIVAREGEREGMDMVVEFPETFEEQEARREEQMEQLYQLRLQRRQELAERESRRQERRDARARGDSTRLEQLAQESRARSNRRREANTSDTSLAASTIIAEHRPRERKRRISTVSYAEIGHVRHDGSRLRADSHDSDNHPLLQNAVNNSSSPSLMDPSCRNSRVQSLASSITSASIAAMDIDPLALRPTSTRGSGRQPPQTDEGEDLGTLNIPPPPDYDHIEWGDAPAYESPITEQNDRPQQLPRLTCPPSIHINPTSPMAVSPVSPNPSPSGLSDEHSSTPPTPTGSVPGPGVSDPTPVS